MGTKYVSGWNMPGTIPETDPVNFDNIEDALNYIRDELRTVVDQEPLEDVPSKTEVQARNALADLRPDNETSWWTPGTPYESGDVGGYVYWVTEIP